MRFLPSMWGRWTTARPSVAAAAQLTTGRGLARCPARYPARVPLGVAAINSTRSCHTRKLDNYLLASNRGHCVNLHRQ